MTTFTALASPAGHVGARPVLALARLEMRGYARRVSVWLGWAATVAAAALTHPDWPGGSYQQAVPVSFSALALGTYVAAVRTGGRDAETGGGVLAEEAALDGPARATARVLGLAFPVGLALVTVLGVAVVSRTEGGFWMGEGARRTDAALHTASELVQPVLLVAIAGAVGVAAGRVVRRAVLAIVLGVFAWTALFPLAWIWNGEAMYPVALVQTMPLRVQLADVHTFGDTPAGWWVESPGPHHRHYGRQLVHQPTVLLHHVYLCGLLAIASAGSLGRGKAVVRVTGVALVVMGLIGQWAASPL